MRVKTATILASLMLAASGAGAFARPAVASTDANLRSDPSVDSPLVAVIAAGAPLDVGSCTGSWCRVSATGGEGYLARSTFAFGVAPVAAVVAPVVVTPALPVGGPYLDEYAYDDNGPYHQGRGFFVDHEPNGSGLILDTFYQGGGYGAGYRVRYGHRFGGGYRPLEAAGPR
jgi:uncharacterized protein YraI